MAALHPGLGRQVLQVDPGRAALRDSGDVALVQVTAEGLDHDVGRLEQAASVTLGVCVIDNEHSNVLGALATEQIKNVALAASAKKGYLDGRDLASVFLWLRPNELIWPYAVSNWLLGKEPPAFDILYWNADPVRMTAGMHRDFMDLAIRNALVEPDASEILGSKVDLSKVDVDSYVVAGIADHLGDAGRWIDLDLTDMAAVRVGSGRALADMIDVERLRSVRRQFHAIAQLVRQFHEADRAIGARHRKTAFRKLDVPRGRFQCM